MKTNACTHSESIVNKGIYVYMCGVYSLLLWLCVQLYRWFYSLDQTRHMHSLQCLSMHWHRNIWKYKIRLMRWEINFYILYMYFNSVYMCFYNIYFHVICFCSHCAFFSSTEFVHARSLMHLREWAVAHTNSRRRTYTKENPQI